MVLTASVKRTNAEDHRRWSCYRSVGRQGAIGVANERYSIGSRDLAAIALGSPVDRVQRSKLAAPAVLAGAPEKLGESIPLDA